MSTARFLYGDCITIMPSIHLLIKGKVQGVYYRASAKEVAERLHLTGWVKNTREGHVEALANGKEEDLRRFVEWCRKGPERAIVSDIIELAKITDEEERGTTFRRSSELAATAQTSMTGFLILRD
ncbi:MAG: acylphosphatase [Chitinophagaceae bacterium]|nr:acylphosphatase [Chitinophagaceae bacterium]